jgi:PAS domain S-box-containing protein
MSEKDAFQTKNESLHHRLNIDLALKAARLGVWELDAQTNTVSWDERCRTLFGLHSDSPLQYEQALSHVHPDDANFVNEAVQASMAPGSDGSYDVTFRTIGADDSKLRWVRFTGQSYFSDDGMLLKLAGVAQEVSKDVLERKTVEDSERHYRKLIEQAPFATAVYHSRDLIIEIANAAMIKLWGKDYSVIGTRLENALPELNGQPFIEILRRVFDTATEYKTTEQQVYLNFDGSLQGFWFNFTYRPLTDEHGRVYAILNMAVDVTNQVVTSKKVVEAEERLRGAIELAELATWTLDIKRQKFIYSDRFKFWLGFSEDSKSIDEAYNPLPDDFRQQVADSIADVIQVGSSGIYQNEHPIINRLTGEQRIIDAQARVFYDTDGLPEFLIGTARDVTRQHQLQVTLEKEVQYRTEELEAANEELASMNEELAAINEEFAATNEDLAEANQSLTRSNLNLEQFAYVASHDLQEPLRKIKQFGDLLKAQYADPSAKELFYLERMQSAATRMSALITDLLALSKISSQQEITALVSLDQVVHSALADLDLRIQETGAVIEVEQLPTVLGDEAQLGQLFQNLLSNALKFKQIDVPVLIQVKADVVGVKDLPPSARPAHWAQAYHRIDVIDNGIGFDQTYSDRIFQVFQRLHGKSEFEGTGIGLAICEKVAANHGGTITAVGEKNVGARFSVWLPLNEV